jgi:23S rRNA (cytidine1920-2'-O)/16S rRNA (cytidine1409-2'-O)-methyltransferase
VTRRRLDAELVRRGLAATPAQAREAVRAGLVTLGGTIATKASTLVSGDAAVGLAAAPARFVSRGGHKLQAALDRFDAHPAGLDCLDAGASTGGFTDCLLQAGVAHVASVDVAYGQLAWELRTDPRVIVMERTNVRDLAPGDLPFAPELVVADLSFVSLRSVVPALVRLAAPAAALIVLVKPQFEAGRGAVEPGGVVRDQGARRRAVEGVAQALARAGAPAQALMPSPLPGPAGNVEFLMLARRGAREAPFDLGGAVAAAPGAWR